MKYRRLIAFVAMACALVALLVAGVVILDEIDGAVEEWEAVGGSVSSEYGPFPPRQIGLGDIVGRTYVGQAEEVAEALGRMSRLPGCDEINLQGPAASDFSAEEISTFLEAFQPSVVTAGRVELDDSVLVFLSNNCNVDELSISDCPVSAEGLRAFLDKSDDSVVRIGKNGLSRSEAEELKAAYGDRIRFLADDGQR